MTLTTRRFFVLALAFAAPSAAQASPEALSASAALSFQTAVFGPSVSSFRPHAAAGVRPSVQISAVVDSWDQYLRDHTSLVGESIMQAVTPTLAAELDLKVLLNRQLKTSLRYEMGGKTVWCGGAFDRQQNAYLSVLVDGEAARYYDVKHLYGNNLDLLKIGPTTYRVWLSANIFNKLKSEIVFTDMSRGRDAVRFNLKTMLASVADAGAPVALSGQSYRVFYTDGLSGNMPDAAARLFTFLMTDSNGDLHVYLIPAESVPSDRIAVFKLFADRPVGLTRQGDVLKIYENP